MLTTRDGARAGPGRPGRLPRARGAGPGRQRLRRLPRPAHQPRRRAGSAARCGAASTADELVAGCHLGRQPGPGAVHARRRRGAFADGRCAGAAPSATIVGPAGRRAQRFWERLEPRWGRRGRSAGTSRTSRSVASRRSRADPGVRRHHPRGPGRGSTPRAWRCTPRRSASRRSTTRRGGPLPRAGPAADRPRLVVRALRRPAGVVFKAEVACATPYAAQVQGVYVRPDRRGEGLAVARHGGRRRPRPAPRSRRWSRSTSTSGTPPARAAYERVGFEQTATFATVMF